MGAPASSLAVVLLVAALGGCSGDDAAGATTGAVDDACAGETVETKAIRYADTDAKNTLDLYRPKRGDRCPLVIWIHGGAWEKDFGLVGSPARDVMPLVERGYAVAALRFRVSSDAPFPAEIFDVKAAVRHLRAHAAELGLDDTRFLAWGVSSGGHLASLLAVSRDVPALEDPSQGSPGVSASVRALVDCYGPTDLPAMDAELLSNGCPKHAAYHDDPTSPESRFLGCDAGLTDCPVAHDADPVTYVDGDDPPARISHGLADCTVPWEQSKRLHDALAGAGVATTLTLVPGSGHELSSCGDLADVYAFVDDRLR